jgi:large subunit ribosomal protein L7Ae
MFFSDYLKSILLKTKNKEELALFKKPKIKLRVFYLFYSEKTVQKSRPYHLKFGLNHVTKLIEEKKAKLVVIASNVDPIELVVWLPTLCRKLDIPYCFVHGKARLGQLVHQKNAAVVALTEVRKEDEGDLNNLASAFRTNYNENQKLRKEIGGFKRGAKSQTKFDRVQKEKERETILKNQ